MRAAVVSDIHGNLVALQAVVRDASQARADEFWCLGDVVGYGPKPRQCLTILQRVVRPDAWVLGNHDAACVGIRPAVRVDDPVSASRLNAVWWRGIGSINGFHEDAIAALRVNWRLLRRDATDRDHLRNRPVLAALDNEFALVHGGLRNQTPLLTYTLSRWDAPLEFQALQQTRAFGCRYMVLGHSHLPALFRAMDAASESPSIFTEVDISTSAPLDLGSYAIVNPGSVGQPRDRNPLSSYAIIDTSAKTVEFRRVRYDIHQTQAHMRHLQLPCNLVNRLSVGA